MDPLLREAIWSQLGFSQWSHVRVTNTSATLSVSSQLASKLSQSVVYTLSSMNQQSRTADIFSSHQSDSHNSPLAVRVHQFRANMNYMIDPLAAQVHQSGSNMDDPLAAWVHQGEVNSVMNPNGGHQIDISNENSAGPSDIDLVCYRVMMNTCSMPY